MREPRALAQVHVADMVGQAAVFAEREVVLDQCQRCIVAQVDEVAQVHAGIAGRRRSDEHQVQGGRGVAVGADDHAFLRQRGIGHREHVVGTGIATLQDIGIARRAFAEDARQRQYLEPFGQAVEQAAGVVEAAIDEDHARRRDGFKHDCQRIGIDTWSRRSRDETAALQRPQRGVLPGFAARAGQAVMQRTVQRIAAALAEAGGVARGERLERGGERIEQGTHVRPPAPAPCGLPARRSRALRVPARVRGHRSRRCGRRPAHAPRPA